MTMYVKYKIGPALQCVHRDKAHSLHGHWQKKNSISYKRFYFKNPQLGLHKVHFYNVRCILFLKIYTFTCIKDFPSKKKNSPDRLDWRLKSADKKRIWKKKNQKKSPSRTCFWKTKSVDQLFFGVALVWYYYFP